MTDPMNLPPPPPTPPSGPVVLNTMYDPATGEFTYQTNTTSLVLLLGIVEMLKVNFMDERTQKMIENSKKGDPQIIVPKFNMEPN